MVRDEKMVDFGKREAEAENLDVFEGRVNRAVPVTRPPPRPTKSATTTRTSTVTLR